MLQQLGRWGGPLLAESSGKDEFRSHWLSLPARHHLEDRAPERPPITIEVRTGGDPLIIETVGGAVRTRSGSARNPDAVLSGTPRLIVGVLTGRLSLRDARAAGLRYEGDPETLRRV